MTFTTRPELRGTFGAVASTHWLASGVGMAILEQGGNAFDAAVAAGFVLQVAEPHLNGPGGEVPIAVHHAAQGITQILCGQGSAPAAATIGHYRDLGLDLIPGSGLLATVVPGAFDAWLVMLRDYGSLPVRRVMEYAIGYAEMGVPVLPGLAAAIARAAPLFRAEWPSSAAVYLPHGKPPEPGTRLANQGLAATWRRLLAEAEARSPDRETQIEALRDAWYRGFVAEAIEVFAASHEVMDSSGRRHRGIITADDLADWEARYEAPTTLEWHGWTVCKTGPWGQGPVFLQQLALLDGLDLESMPHLGPDFVHHIVEAAKLAFADREAYFGDPAFISVPLSQLLSPEYAAARRSLMTGRASSRLQPGKLPGYSPRLDHLPKDRGAPAGFEGLGSGEPTLQTEAPGDTCHLDVIDRWGNMVSATPSGGWLQSSPVIPDLGFGLNTRAQMFWLEEGLPGSLAPGKRPRTTLSVSMAFHKDGRQLCFGTPGGDYQDQWSLHFFLRHVIHGLNLQAAIDAPAFQTDHMPSSFWPRRHDPGSLTLEGRFPPDTVEELARRGHRITRADDWSLGRLSAVGRDPDGQIKAAANPRFMQGYAVAR